MSTCWGNCRNTWLQVSCHGPSCPRKTKCIHLLSAKLGLFSLEFNSARILSCLQSCLRYSWTGSQGVARLRRACTLGTCNLPHVDDVVLLASCMGRILKRMDQAMEFKHLEILIMSNGTWSVTLTVVVKRELNRKSRLFQIINPSKIRPSSMVTA